MELRRFLDITDFSRDGLREALNLMAFIVKNRDTYAGALSGRTVALSLPVADRNAAAFFRFAAARMNGQTIDFAPQPGETLRDTAAVLSACSDIIVMNHPKKGAARAMSLYSRVPVVNAGDGGRAYPVRTLADFASVWNKKQHVSNMNVGFLGNFENNALVRGLLQCLNIYKGNEFYFISVNGKPVSDDYVNLMDRREKPFEVYDNLFEILPQLDVLYMTKVDASDFESEIMYESRRHNFTVDERVLMTAKPDLVVLHGFPRGAELDVSADNTAQAAYFDQLGYEVDACTAILLKMVQNRAGRLIQPHWEGPTHDCVCGKPDCITSDEPYLPPLFHEAADGSLICKYCGAKIEQ